MLNDQALTPELKAIVYSDELPATKKRYQAKSDSYHLFVAEPPHIWFTFQRRGSFTYKILIQNFEMPPTVP